MFARTILYTAVVTLFSATLIWAQPGRDRLRLHEELKLSDQQQEQLKELHFNAAREQIRIKANLKIVRLELRHMMAEDEPEKEMIFRKLEQISRLQTEIRKNQIEKNLAVREILNKKQLEKLRKLQRAKRLHHWRKKAGFGRRLRDWGPGIDRRLEPPRIGVLEENFFELFLEDEVLPKLLPLPQLEPLEEMEELPTLESKPE